MPISRVTTWASGQTLTASALNGEFNNILNNGTSLWSPATASVSMAGFAFVLDNAGVTSIQSPGTSGFLLTPGAKAGTPGTTGGSLNVAAHTYTDSATAASGTATSWTGVSLQQPTLAASNSSVVTTDAATFYIANRPAAGTNQTLTNAWAFWVDDGAVRLDLTTSKPSSASAVCRALYLPAATQTISGSTNITTAAGYNFIEIAQPTMSAGTALTITNSATLYIADAPTGAGAGPAAITNPYALWVDSGAVRFDGAATVAGALDCNSTMTLAGQLTLDGTNNGILSGGAPANPVANVMYKESIVKGWALVSVSGGTPSITTSHNVSGITDGGVGLLTVTWNTDFSSANYCTTGTARGVAGSNHLIVAVDDAVAPTAGAIKLTCYTGGNAAADPTAWNVSAIGGQ